MEFLYTPLPCNCPPVCAEGLAVGVGFGAIGTSPSATLERARQAICAKHLHHMIYGVGTYIRICMNMRGGGV